MITLTLPYPISSNRYWASRVLPGKGIPIVYVTGEAKAYKAEVAKAARAAGITSLMGGRYVLDAQLYPHRPQDWKTRQRKLGDLWDDTVQCIDLDNCVKVLSDALQGTVFANDNKARRIVLDRMEPDDKGARLVVTITPRVVVNPQGDLLGTLA